MCLVDMKESDWCVSIKENVMIHLERSLISNFEQIVHGHTLHYFICMARDENNNSQPL